MKGYLRVNEQRVRAMHAVLRLAETGVEAQYRDLDIADRRKAHKWRANQRDRLARFKAMIEEAR